MFTSDLVRELSIPVEVDFMTTSSYGDSETSSGCVEIVNDVRTSIKDRDILIVDDIIDSGYTLKKVINHLNKESPNSISICTMLDKPSRRDRKSTRLNSSHVSISYAVFCLKKKK